MFLQESSKTLQDKGDVDSSKHFLDQVTIVLIFLTSRCHLQASQLFERAVTGVMKKCCLLYFTYADFEEQNMKFEKVKGRLKLQDDNFGRSIRSTRTSWWWRTQTRPSVMSRYTSQVSSKIQSLQYMKFCRRAEGIKEARTVFKKAREDERSNFHV